MKDLDSCEAGYPGRMRAHPSNLWAGGFRSRTRDFEGRERGGRRKERPPRVQRSTGVGVGVFGVGSLGPGREGPDGGAFPVLGRGPSRVGRETEGRGGAPEDKRVEEV